MKKTFDRIENTKGMVLALFLLSAGGIGALCRFFIFVASKTPLVSTNFNSLIWLACAWLITVTALVAKTAYYTGKKTKEQNETEK
jgi:hypothetical protein